MRKGIWITSYINNASDSGGNDQAFTNSAGVGCDINCGVFGADFFFGGLGEEVLFGAESIADFSVRAGRDITNIADAAEFVTVELRECVVVGFEKVFSFRVRENARNLRAQAC